MERGWREGKWGGRGWENGEGGDGERGEAGFRLMRAVLVSMFPIPQSSRVQGQSANSNKYSPKQ